MGSIPILSDIWETLKWLIDFFVNKVPKPVLFLIFLLMMVVIGFLLSFIFHLVGYHCNSNMELVKVDSMKVLSNIDIAFISNPDHVVKGTGLTVCDVYPNKCGQEHDCYYYAQQLPNGLYDYCNITNASADCKYYLKEGVCHNCTEDEICFQSALALGFICGEWHSICTSNAFELQESQALSTATTLFAGRCDTSCAVPEYYMWDIDTGTFTCLDDAKCGENSTFIKNTELDEKLHKANAVAVYKTNINENDYTQFLRLSCNRQLNPEVTAMGLPIFDYQLWLLLAVLWVGTMFLLKLRQVHI